MNIARRILVISTLLICCFSITGCFTTAEEFSTYSERGLCMQYYTTGTLHPNRFAAKKAINARGIDCTPYKAAAFKFMTGQPNHWKTLEKGVRDIERNRPKCTAFTFSKAGVKQCLN